MKIYSKEEVENFIATENLKYQKIELPFGLSTPGDARDQAVNIMLREIPKGSSVLDIGSYLGQMCIMAIKNGASEAVGIELDPDKIRQAEMILDILNLQKNPIYLREDIEKFNPEKKSDVILLLNVLHHFKDPISVLRKLSLIADRKLLIEAASFNDRDSGKIGIGIFFRRWLKRRPFIFCASGNPKELNQTYFFSESALRNILDGHYKCYWKINRIESKFKGRFFLECNKLKIDRMILVAGSTASGKSTFCDGVIRNLYRDKLGYDDYSEVPFVSPSKIWGKELHKVFPNQHEKECLMHYDIAGVKKFKFHSYARDPAIGVVECAKQVDVVLVAPSLTTIEKQLIASELSGEGAKVQSWHKNLLNMYGRKNFLADLYIDWLNFLETLDCVVNVYIFHEVDNERKLLKIDNLSRAKDLVRGIYN